MILDFRNGDPALLVGYRGAPACDHAWGCPWQHTVASNQAVTLLCVGGSFPLTSALLKIKISLFLAFTVGLVLSLLLVAILS